MRFHRSATIFAVAVALSAAGCSKSEKAGCKKDTDCKGQRVCEKGKCVSAAGDKIADAKQKPASAKAAPGSTKVPTAPRPAPNTPGSTVPAPGGGPPPGGIAGAGIQICLGAQCATIGGPGASTKDLMQVFGMLQKLMIGGLSGMGGPKQKLRVCARGQCVTLDKSLLQNPMALLKLFSRLSPNLLQKLFNGMIGRLPGHRAPGTPRSTPQLTPRGAPKLKPPSAHPKGPVTQTFRTFDELRKAGSRAVGRVAELPGLSITSVSDTRLVLEGPGKEMIVLKIPRALKSLLPKLRITTQRVTVRFRVLSRPIGKLLHGELVTYN